MNRKTITYLVELFSLVKTPFPVSFYDLNLSRYGARKHEKGTFKSDAIRTQSDRRCDVIGLTRSFIGTLVNDVDEKILQNKIKARNLVRIQSLIR